MGNICRSPTLAAALQRRLEEGGKAGEWRVDSRGLSPFYEGKPVDRRMRAAARRHGLVIDHIAQLFQMEDVARFDQIFAVDAEVYAQLQVLVTSPQERKKIQFVGDFSRTHEGMEDPFGGGEEGFESTVVRAEEIADGIYEAFISKA